MIPAARGALQGCAEVTWRDARAAAPRGPKHEKQWSHQPRGESSAGATFSSPVSLRHLTRTLAPQILGRTERATYMMSSPARWGKLVRCSTRRVGDDSGKQRSRKVMGCLLPPAASWEAFICRALPSPSFTNKPEAREHPYIRKCALPA